MPHREMLLALALVISACQSGGGQTPPAAADLELAIDFESYRLDNGLTVILHEDQRLPLVAVSVWYDVGALQERPGRSGFAHLFEHMMFQGSAHVPEDQHFRILQEVGATGVNGTTNFDRTNYFETVPSSALETALWLESDRMGFLLPALTEASLANQIDVVQNERRQSVENRPYGLMSEKLTKLLFPAPHPYNGDVIGTLEDIASATREDVADFFKTYYTPSNATLALAGDFDLAQTKALIEKYFGTLKGLPKPAATQVETTPIEAETVVHFVEPVGKLEKISVAWMGPPAFAEGTAALDLLAHVISGERSSRLDRKVSYEDPMAQSVTAYFREMEAASVFQIDMVMKQGRTTDEGLAAIDEVLAGLRGRPPTAAELQRARNDWETSTLTSLQSLGGFGGRTERLQSYHHFLGDPGKLGWDVARHRKIDLAALQEAMKLLDDKRIVLKAAPPAEGDAS
ncbi:MAG: pitrilysin family protein [Myxococcota bacterium]